MTSLDRRNDVSQEEAAVPGEVRRWRAFALLAVAFFMTIVDLTIVNVALPTIGRKPHFPEWAFWVTGLTALAAVPVTFLLIRRTELAAAASLQRGPAVAAAG
jgi:MFS family permease